MTTPTSGFEIWTFWFLGKNLNLSAPISVVFELSGPFYASLWVLRQWQGTPSSGAKLGSQAPGSKFLKFWPGTMKWDSTSSCLPRPSKLCYKTWSRRVFGSRVSYKRHTWHDRLRRIGANVASTALHLALYNTSVSDGTWLCQCIAMTG